MSNKLMRSVLFYTCLILAIKSSTGLWDFWPFNINKITTPTIKIYPETDNNFIHVKLLDEHHTQQYIDSINRFLNTYKTIAYPHNIARCDFNYSPPKGQFCNFDNSRLGHCGGLKDFGYDRGDICIFFTLSQVLNWTPIALNESDIQQAHSDQFLNMPDHLNSTVANAVKEKPNETYIWFTCEGETAADKEFIGPVTYYPRRGFPTYYFPFTNIEGYQSPVVALYFERPMRDVVINVVCKLWAKNIQLNQDNGTGFVKFNLLIE